MCQSIKVVGGGGASGEKGATKWFFDIFKEKKSQTYKITFFKQILYIWVKNLKPDPLSINNTPKMVRVYYIHLNELVKQFVNI